MDVVELAKAAAQALAPALPFLLEIGKTAQAEATKELGDGAWQAAKRFWSRLTGLGSSGQAVTAAATEVATAPGDPDALAALRLQLRKLLAEHPELLAETETFLQEAQRAPSVSVTVIGSGAAAAGQGAIAGGEGATIITGSVGGDVRIGDANRLPKTGV